MKGVFRVFMDKKNQRPEFHGSDLEKIAAYYHIPASEIPGIIKFGANVNPLGLSESVKNDLAGHLDIISSYPDRNYTSLKKTIGEYCHISPEHIVVGNGSTELISLLISQRQAKKALVVGPTYSEYERELALTGGTITEYNLKEDLNFQLDLEDFFASMADDVDLLILCNPNNPTSSAIKNRDMKHILNFCNERNIFVMIDETYVEFAPDIAEITAISLTDEFDNVMVIRGVSKFYAPGLRFGYGITSNHEFLEALLIHQNPWSLNSVAAYAGERMFKDSAYQQTTRQLICSERDRMYTAIQNMPAFKAYKPYANFILVHILKEGLTSFDIFEAAIKERMMIRDCSSFKSLDGEYIRFCIMNPEDNTHLLKLLEQF